MRDLNDWQDAVYRQLEHRPLTVEQVMEANALPRREITKVLRDLEQMAVYAGATSPD